MDFHDRLHELRHKKKITQSQLADVIGLKPTAISNYESGRHEPSFDRLKAMASFFNVSSDYLLGISDAYVPLSEEILNREVVELFNRYQSLNQENRKKLDTYMQFLEFEQNSPS